MMVELCYIYHLKLVPEIGLFAADMLKFLTRTESFLQICIDNHFEGLFLVRSQLHNPFILGRRVYMSQRVFSSQFILSHSFNWIQRNLRLIEYKKRVASVRERNALVWWIDPGWMPGAHQSCSITPPPQLDRGEKIQQKSHGSRSGQGEITQQLPTQVKET